jgi:hypothetical protein
LVWLPSESEGRIDAAKIAISTKRSVGDIEGTP